MKDKITNINIFGTDVKNVNDEIQLERIANSFADRLFEPLTLSFDRSLAKPDSGSEIFDFNTADKLINKAGGRTMVENKRLNYVTYFFPYNFDEAVFLYAKIGSGIRHWGSYNVMGQPTIYFFTENELDDAEIEVIKAKKTALFDRIEKTIEETKGYVKSKKEELRPIFLEILKTSFKNNQKRLELNSKL